MNIAHLLPTSAIFPLKKHNGRYEWALRLARAQAAEGHSVTMYAGAGSSDDQPIQWMSISDSSDSKKDRNIALLTKAFSNTSHDIYHSHFDSLHYIVADQTDKPIIVTQHWYPTTEIADAVPYNTKKNVFAVPLTDMMKKEDERLGIPATQRIYHGVDLSLFQPAELHSDRFLFIGRIHPSKGIAQAIHYAKLTGVPLDIIGKVNASEAAFWDSLQQDIDGQTIRYLGQQPQPIVAETLAQAKALLFPSQHAEAFGQVTIEAQAAGTPVIISDVGASSELVIEGKTGFICRTDNDYTNAITNISSIDRHACRAHAEQFDFKTMVNRYNELYNSVVTRSY